MAEKADAVGLGSYKKALDAEKGDSPNADSQKRDCSFQVKQVLKGEDVPKTITVSKEYSIRMTHQAEGQDIPYQMPVYTFTEPQMGETYLLFLKEGQKTYSLSSEPGKVRKDGKEAAFPPISSVRTREPSPPTPPRPKPTAQFTISPSNPVTNRKRIFSPVWTGRKWWRKSSLWPDPLPTP